MTLIVTKLCYCNVMSTNMVMLCGYYQLTMKLKVSYCNSTIFVDSLHYEPYPQ